MSFQAKPRVLFSRQEIEATVGKLTAHLGTTLPSPFSTLSLVALPVIPELRLTDLGLVDVGEFRLIKRGE